MKIMTIKIKLLEKTINLLNGSLSLVAREYDEDYDDNY
mgnify:CR=1 FL=1